MADILITPDTLKQYAAEIDGIRHQFNSLMSNLKGAMTAMKQEYESDAAAAFMNEFNKLDANVQGYAAEMQKYSNYLNDTAQQFAAADQTIDTNIATVANVNLYA